MSDWDPEKLKEIAVSSGEKICSEWDFQTKEKKEGFFSGKPI